MSDRDKLAAEYGLHLVNNNPSMKFDAASAASGYRAGFDAGERSPRVMALLEHLKLALSFAPKGPVPEGLCPMFYHTLNYQDELELQQRIDAAREALKQWEGGAE